MTVGRKLVKFDIESRESLLEGINVLADAVKTTMGPCGKNVVIEVENAHPIVTKDGVTVAKAINLRSRFPNLGVQMIKEAASRTADVAGDGTTTATVLSQAIFSEGLKALAAGYSAIDIKKGIEIGCSSVVDNLRMMAIPVTRESEILQIATISANSEKEIGELILSAISAVGRDGTITVEEAKGFKSELGIVEGMQINRGYLSPYFITDQERMLVEMENPRIFLCNKKIDSLREITPLLEQSLSRKQPMLIVADDVDGDALQGLVVNRVKGVLKACAIKAPGFGESRLSLLEDLACVLGCKVYSDASNDNVEEIDIDDLGKCKKVIISRTGTVFVGGKGSKREIEERIEALRSVTLDITKDDDETMFIKERMARLSGGIAVLRVGGATEAELSERKDRVDDALNSTQAAIDEGILPGGGIALYRASRNICDTCFDPSLMIGVSVIKKACEAPFKQIVDNAGGVPEVILEKASSMKDSHGYDAATENFGDMFDMGIIDPLKVVRSALENASSAASMLLTVGCTLVSDE